MPARSVTFRFDVDTHRCGSTGLQNLLAIGQEFGVPFTFFVNFGRAVSVPSSVRSLLTREHGDPAAAHLPAIRKLGALNFLIASLLNPPNHLWSVSTLKQAVEDGHEIGLHGGRNHATWAKKADKWSREKLREEIAWGLENLRKIDRSVNLIGFASPDWNTPPSLGAVLRDLGFTYVADSRSTINDPNLTCHLAEIATKGCAEPGGVAYFEHLVARGLSQKEIVAQFLESLACSEDDHFVVYDHPYFVGHEGQHMFRAVLATVLSQGIDVRTLRSAFE